MTGDTEQERAEFIQWRMNEVRADEMSAAHVWDNNYLEARAWKASAARRAPVVPQGWTLVPVEPTPEMGERGADEVVAPISEAWSKAASVYTAMLAAAPQPPDGAAAKQSATNGVK